MAKFTIHYIPKDERDKTNAVDKHIKLRTVNAGSEEQATAGFSLGNIAYVTADYFEPRKKN